MGIRETQSAGRHGILREDWAHAIAHRVLFLPGYDQSRTGDGAMADLIVGPMRDGRLLEVLVHRDDDTRDVLVFHVMLLRRSTAERARSVMDARARKREQK